jgi:hypothetical protein
MVDINQFTTKIAGHALGSMPAGTGCRFDMSDDGTEADELLDAVVR